MRIWIRASLAFGASAAALLSLLLLPASGQNAAYKAPRGPDGHANMNGIWQAVNTANWDLQDHAAYAGPMWEVGAIGAVPAGQGVVEGTDIPYTPAAAAKKKENFKNRRTDDPEAKCYMPGIPRANYMPYPFQIVQTNKDILFVYEYASSNRLVNMGQSPKKRAPTPGCGTNNGRWEGDTLVVDVTGLNGLAWFDRAGDFQSDKTLHHRALPPVPTPDPVHHLRSDDRRSVAIHKVVEDQHAALPPRGEERAVARVQVRRVRRRTAIRKIQKAAVE